MGKKNKIYLLAYALIIFLVPAIWKNNYHLMVLNIAALNIVVVIGLNLLMGFAGQISLGHAAFFGLGAYLSAIFTATFGFPLWPTIILAMVITGMVAYAIGIPTLKLEGHYLVMATLGFNIIIYILMIQLDGVTGGPSGFPGIPRLQVGGFVFDSDRKIYYLLWTISVGTLLLSLNLIHSRVGRAMAALSHNEIAARCAGIDTENYKVKVFVISAVLASLAGSCYAHYITFISPGTFSFFYSIQVVTMVLIGGIGSLWGSVFGAILLTILPEILHAVKEYNVLIYGIILMVVLIFFPQGLFPVVAGIFRKRKDEARSGMELVPGKGP
ncbi:MAG: branched-chain amino acid ABC transporter permease [Thermodesulfobacteriota bacterium]|nr:branched-chain amino acid ABC transporter permease [Thermodesulfobacteriota bacterium]